MKRLRRSAVACLIGAFVVVGVPSPAGADQIRDRQWYLAPMHIAEAQQISKGKGVVVAVVDTGVDDKRHGELTGAVVEGKEFGEHPTGDGRNDTDGHGTAMAGIIAARGLAAGGMLGIAPEATILPVQTIHSDIGGAPPDLGHGIDWAVAHGAKVICIAAGTSPYPEVRSAIEAALRADVVVVAAAGNQPAVTSVAFPAKLPGVLAVGGTDKEGNHAVFSARGPELVISAPAVDVVSTGAFGKYESGDGTSNSTAIVVGVVALVRARFPQLSGVEVVRRLTATATDRGKVGRDEEFGYGIVNPVAALTAELGPEPSASVGGSESVSSAGPGGGSHGDGGVWAGVAAGGGILLVVVGVLVLRRRTRGRAA